MRYRDETHRNEAVFRQAMASHQQTAVHCVGRDELVGRPTGAKETKPRQSYTERATAPAPA